MILRPLLLEALSATGLGNRDGCFITIAGGSYLITTIMGLEMVSAYACGNPELIQGIGYTHRLYYDLGTEFLAISRIL
jgi:hypothetical protein